MLSNWQKKTKYVIIVSQRLLKMIVNLCRIIVAVTFIFSGFVKAIDPIGTQYKLQDYLGAIGMAGILPKWQFSSQP